MPDSLHLIAQVITGVAVAVYAVGVLANLGLGVYKLIRPQALSSQYPKLDIWAAVSSSQSFNQRAAVTLRGLQAAVAWPGATHIGLRMVSRRTNVQYSAWFALELTDRRYALFGSAAAATVVILAGPDLIWEPFVIGMTVALLVGTVCRHISYLLVGIGDRLRTSRWSPLRVLALIAACDAVTLLLAVSVLLSHGDGGTSVSQLGEAARGLYAFDNLGSLLDESALNVLVALIGLLFYSAVVRTILTPSTYSRSDEDYAVIAFCCVCAGTPDEARRWLAKQQQLTSTAFVTRAAIKLQAGDFEQALEEAAAAREMEHQDSSEEEAMVLLWQILMPGLSPTEEQTIDFLKRCVEHRASDAMLCMVCVNSVLSELVPPERLSDAASELLLVRDYPLTRAVISIFAVDLDSAREILDRASPGSEIEELLRVVYLAELELLEELIAEEEKTVDWEAWRRRTVPTLAELALEVPRSWKKTLAATALAPLGTSLAETSPTAEEELMALVRRLSADMMSDAQLDRLLAAQQQIQAT